MTTIDRLAGWITETLSHHMLEASCDPVVVVNGDDRIVLVSRAGAALGWSRVSLIGRRWDEVVELDVAGPGADAAMGGTAHPEAGRHSARVRCGDGTERDAIVTRYATRLPDVGPVAVLVVSALRRAA